MGTDSALPDAYERDEVTPIHAKFIWALSLNSKVTSPPLKCALRDVAVVCWAASGCNKEVKLKTIITRMDEAKNELDKLAGTPEGRKVNMPSCVMDVLIPILGDAEEPDANKKSDITSTTALTDNDFNVRKVQGDAEASSFSILRGCQETLDIWDASTRVSTSILPGKKLRSGWVFRH